MSEVLAQSHPELADVVIGGVRYVPAGGSALELGHRIGIGVTTRNRRDIAMRTLADIRLRTPGAHLVLVDDASDPKNLISPDEFVDLGVDGYHRFSENVGIARAKNRCIEMLYDAGCEHIFLFDDDAWPLVDDWYEPYVASPEPHLMRIFEDLAGPRKLNDIARIFRDDRLLAYSGPRGVMLYVERRVLDVVGGMDIAYGKWGYEHGDWSNRIHNAGFTTHRFADVVGSEGLIYSLDEHEQVQRGTEKTERAAMVKQNVKRYLENWGSRQYKSFREPRNAVLTCWFVEGVDPQRPKGGARVKDLAALSALTLSLRGQDLVVFTDGGPMEHGPGVELEQVVVGVANLYVQRWISYWNWLRDHPEVEWVWCVDGTDVEQLRQPWEEMQPGVLYLGTEPKLTDDAWMRKNTSPQMQLLIAQHGRDQLLNAGLVGGDRATVMEFLHRMITVYFDNQIRVSQGKETDFTHGVNDMGILNYVGRRWWEASRLVTGPLVNTTFKAEEKNGWSWWKHK